MRKPKSIGAGAKRTMPREPVARTQIEMEIGSLAALDLDALRAAWLKRFRKSAPGIQSRDILLRLFAARIQEAAFGALPKDTLKALLRAAQEIASEGRARIVKEPMPPTGSMLSRDWRGTVHTVTVLETGFAYQGHVFATLSAIVRQITGTHSSGPAFFGLRPKKDRPPADRPGNSPSRSVAQSATLSSTVSADVVPERNDFKSIATDPERSDMLASECLNQGSSTDGVLL